MNDRNRPLGQLLFGQQATKYAPLFSKENLTPAEAHTLLDAVEHPELSRVRDHFRDRLKADPSSVAYEADFSAYLSSDASPTPDPNNFLLFSDWAYWNGFTSTFGKIIAAEHPAYRLAKPQSVGALVLEKKIA